MTSSANSADVARWATWETSLRSTVAFDNPLQDALLRVEFTSPSGKEHIREGFWDGGRTWRVRFMPDEVGEWRYRMHLSSQGHAGSQRAHGTFVCGPASGMSPFEQHGPIRMTANRRFLEHADGTPFFWLADTAWNGPLLSTDEEWDHYLRERVRQNFSAVQWVATQWRSALTDLESNAAFTGSESIELNPAFFQRMDRRFQATMAAGLLNVPVMLWANTGGEHPELNPGIGLPEDQAILMARYQVARWGAYPVVWILPGDGRYEGEVAERWRRIGRAVFGDRPHAPVALHLCGQHLPVDEFRGERWLDIMGYQSGHGDSDATLQWIVTGTPAREWRHDKPLFCMNLEPAYENHVAYHSKQPHDAHSVRLATYWSLLNAPTAGVSYGGHGVWGWDDGSAPPADHPNTGVPLPWQEALTMPAAEQMPHLVDAFTALDWWRLEPASELLAEQPGDTDVHRHILLSTTPERDQIVAYTPQGGQIALDASSLGQPLRAVWFDPRTGERAEARSASDGEMTEFQTPTDEDWLLIMRSDD